MRERRLVSCYFIWQISTLLQLNLCCYREVSTSLCGGIFCSFLDQKAIIMPLTLSMWSAMCWFDHLLADRLDEPPCWQSCGTVSKSKKSYSTFRWMCHQRAKAKSVSISNSGGQCFEMLNNCRSRKRGPLTWKMLFLLVDQEFWKHQKYKIAS